MPDRQPAASSVHPGTAADATTGASALDSPFALLLADRRLARTVQRHRAGRGELLFGQGDEAAGLWLVESGRVRIYASDAEGHEQTLQIVGPGESFNEVPFFDRGPEPASAQVLARATLLVIPQSRRDAILAEVPEIAESAAASFASRLRQTVAIISDLSFRHVSGRVALVLLQAVDPHPGVGAGSGGRGVTQREIAEMTGTRREVVARALRRLEEEGLIRIDRGQIVLLDREGLARHA